MTNSSDVENYIVETPICFVCKNPGILTLPASGVIAYELGALAQDAFPELSIPLREQIISGTHPECWEKTFGNGEQENSG